MALDNSYPMIELPLTTNSYRYFAWDDNPDFVNPGVVIQNGAGRREYRIGFIHPTHRSGFRYRVPRGGA